MSLLMNFDVFDQPLDTIDLKSHRIINTINPHSYCMTKKDATFDHVLKNSDVLLPDGVGIVWASKVINNQTIKKIAGFDIFLHFMTKLNEAHGSCFFLGSMDTTLELIKTRAATDFPNVKIGSYSPPYKPTFSKEDTDQMIESVNVFKPDVLFVGMTAPKQEKWAFEHQNALQTDVICSIGAVFDFYAGTIQRSGAFWIKIGLEWLPRFLKEPKRLAERNLVSTPKFIAEVLKHKMKRKNVS